MSVPVLQASQSTRVEFEKNVADMEKMTRRDNRFPDRRAPPDNFPKLVVGDRMLAGTVEKPMNSMMTVGGPASRKRPKGKC